MKILSTLIKPHLKEAFVNFRNGVKKLDKIDKKEAKETSKNNSEKKGDKNQKIEKNFFEEHSYSLEEKSINKRADISFKMNTYMYEKSSSDSYNDEHYSLDSGLNRLREKLFNAYGYQFDFFDFNDNGMQFNDNSLELDNYIRNHRKKKLENNSSNKKSKSSSGKKSSKNFNKKNLKDESNNTDDNVFDDYVYSFEDQDGNMQEIIYLI